MKPIPLIFLSALLVVALVACNVNIGGETINGSGATTSETRTLKDFSEVLLSMPGELEIILGSTPGITIEAQDNLLEYIETEVRGDRLTIQTQPGINLAPTRPIKYTLTTGSLTLLENTSSGNIAVKPVVTDKFSALIRSSGKITLDSLTTDSLVAEISSSGNLAILGGQVKQQDITISSSGNYLAEELTSAQAEVNIKSNGNATVYVTTSLTGSLTSNGNLYYFGSPTTVDVKTTSSGEVIHK